MQTQKETQRSLAVLKNDVLLLTVPVAIMLQNQPRTRQTQKHENKKKVKRVNIAIIGKEKCCMQD